MKLTNKDLEKFEGGWMYWYSPSEGLVKGQIRIILLCDDQFILVKLTKAMFTSNGHSTWAEYNKKEYTFYIPDHLITEPFCPDGLTLVQPQTPTVITFLPLK